MGAISTFFKELVGRFSWIRLLDVVMLDGRHCCPRHARLIAQSGYSYVVTLMDEQPECLRAAEEQLNPLAASRSPEATRLERHQGEWIRSSLWRSQETVNGMDWPHARQVWLVRDEAFHQHFTPQSDSVPVYIEDRYYLTTLHWDQFDGAGILSLVADQATEKMGEAMDDPSPDVTPFP